MVVPGGRLGCGAVTAAVTCVSQGGSVDSIAVGSTTHPLSRCETVPLHAARIVAYSRPSKRTSHPAGGSATSPGPPAIACAAK